MEKLRAAIIGVGTMGYYHAKTYSAMNTVRLAAIADIEPEVGKKVARECNTKYYKDYLNMLDKESIDIVSIAVPTKFHMPVALDVIKRKKHLLIEKPIASNSSEAEAIINAAEKAQVKLLVGHIERFNPAVQTLKYIIQQEYLGNIISIIARRVGLFPPQIKDANVITDLAVHDIDIITYLLDKKPTSILAYGRNALTNQREDSAEILLSYNGVTGFIQVNWITPVKIRLLSVTGSKGYMELNYITQKLELYRNKYTKRADSFGEFVIQFGEATKKEIKIKKKEPLRVELESFVECVKNDTAPLMRGIEAMAALRIAEKALESIHANRIIALGFVE